MGRQSGVVVGFFDKVLRPGALIVKPHHHRDRLGEIGHKHAVGVSAGFKQEGLHGRQTQKKALVAIAAEEDGAGLGRIRMRRIRRASKHQLHGFIQEAVEPDSTIHTDGWEGYVGLEALGYRHEYDFRCPGSGNFQPISL